MIKAYSKINYDHRGVNEHDFKFIMKTLQIEIPEGYEVKDFDKDTGKVSFQEKPKSLMERIKTVDDILAEYSMTQDEFDL